MPLVGGHPVQEPLVGFVFGRDFEVHEELPAEEGGQGYEGFAQQGGGGGKPDDTEALGR